MAVYVSGRTSRSGKVAGRARCAYWGCSTLTFSCGSKRYELGHRRCLSRQQIDQRKAAGGLYSAETAVSPKHCQKDQCNDTGTGRRQLVDAQSETEHTVTETPFSYPNAYCQKFYFGSKQVKGHAPQ